MENGVTTTGEADSLDFCFGPIQLQHLLLIFFFSVLSNCLCGELQQGVWGLRAVI